MSRFRSLRFRLLLAVNGSMALLLLLFLAVDYQREIAAGVAEKHVALEEEAHTLLPGVLRLRGGGRAVVQDYVDAVCSRMQESSSPGHHIAVAIGGEVWQAHAHHRASPEILAAMEQGARAATHRAAFGREELVVGSARSDGVRVYVAEYLTNVRRAAQQQAWQRLARILLLLLTAAAVVNLVFFRMVARPLKRLIDTVGHIGRGNLGALAGPFAASEFACLAEAVNTMSQSLAHADRQRRGQMAKARRIQEHLLPEPQAMPGLNLLHAYHPAEEVTGDYFDALPLHDGAWLLCVADVSGHGVPAAMGAVMLKTLLAHAAEEHTDPADVLAEVNRRFSAISLAEDFASMLLVRWSPGADTLQYASAGHEAGWLLRAGEGPCELPSTGLLLGVDEQATRETRSVPFGCGSRLLLVTDGVTEARSASGQLFGRERLAGAWAGSARLPLPEALECMRSALREHCLRAEATDDITLVVLEPGGDPCCSRLPP